MEDAATEFLKMDEVSSLAELKEKLDHSCLPATVIEVERSDKILFLSIEDNSMGKPTVAYSFVVHESLSFDMWYVQMCKCQIKLLLALAAPRPPSNLFEPKFLVFACRGFRLGQRLVHGTVFAPQ
jgi:hypothetical protein